MKEKKAEYPTDRSINIKDLLTPGGAPRRQAEAWIVAKAQNDESFKRQLLDDPRAVVSAELGIELPQDYKITVFEETAKNICLVVPAYSAPLEAGELADEQLEAVAGGKGGTSVPPVTGGDPNVHTLTMTTSGNFVTDPGGDNAGLN